MDDLRALVEEVIERVGEIAHGVIDLAANAPRLTDEQRRDVAERVHAKVDELEELD